jgi:hypothetical protein
MGKVCNLCRGLETDISAMLTVMSGLGILFDLEIQMIRDSMALLMVLVR